MSSKLAVLLEPLLVMGCCQYSLERNPEEPILFAKFGKSYPKLNPADLRVRGPKMDSLVDVVAHKLLKGRYTEDSVDSV